MACLITKGSVGIPEDVCACVQCTHVCIVGMYSNPSPMSAFTSSPAGWILAQSLLEILFAKTYRCFGLKMASGAISKIKFLQIFGQSIPPDPVCLLPRHFDHTTATTQIYVSACCIYSIAEIFRVRKLSQFRFSWRKLL